MATIAPAHQPAATETPAPPGVTIIGPLRLPKPDTITADTELRAEDPYNKLQAVTLQPIKATVCPTPPTELIPADTAPPPLSATATPATELPQAATATATAPTPEVEVETTTLPTHRCPKGVPAQAGKFHLFFFYLLVAFVLRYSGTNGNIRYSGNMESDSSVAFVAAV